MSLDRRIAVISGATGVTGSLAARTFAEKGASLVLLGTDPHRLDLLAADLGLPPPMYDTPYPPQTERLAAKAAVVPPPDGVEAAVTTTLS